MAVTIPFIQSDTNYALSVALDSVPYVFVVKWNDADKAHYFDMYQGDGVTPIIYGVKVVLGVNLGRRSSDAFFQNHTLTVLDTSNADLDAGYDDLGGRIQVFCVSYS